MNPNVVICTGGEGPPGIARVVNNNGLVAGHWGLSKEDPLPTIGMAPNAGFSWTQAGGFKDITSRGEEIEVLGLNDNGQIIGGAVAPTGEAPFSAFIYDELNGYRSLGLMGGNGSLATGINNAGVAVGISYASLQHRDLAFMWDETNGIQPIPLGFSYSRAWGINNLGQVIGIANEDGFNNNGFIWQAGVGLIPLSNDLSVVDFATPRSINDLSQIVGRAKFEKNSSDQRAVIWDSIHGIRKLETLIESSSGWELLDAYDINNRGQIVGWGRFNGEFRGYVLNPIPEPSIVLIFTVIVGGLLIRTVLGTI
jgi:probable HAF family extracellular repeat protein